MVSCVPRRKRCARPKQQTTLFSLRSPGERVPVDDPLRRVKDMADSALAALDELCSGQPQRSHFAAGFDVLIMNHRHVLGVK
ncbi:hypothetical protein D7V88_40815 [Corallococcus terminator]|uniref:Uncharacterized protein n=1 Tax=Corallococcus terminator TaxID=2316733 RepID=A0A3A8HBI6_9BACT|nr:hypothetical protein D7V88_40815 [Corallococcus terminator]